MDGQYLEISSKDESKSDISIQYEVLSFKDNFILTLKNAIPSYLSVLMEQLSSSISIAFVGHLNTPNELATVGISETFVLILYFYPIACNTGALDTLVSTSYGNKQYYLWGVYLNRAIVILTIFSIPFLIAFLFIEDILLFFGQDPEIAEMSKIYFYYRIPTLLIMLYEFWIKRVLQNMGYFRFLSVLNLIQLLLYMAFITLLFYGFEMDYWGAAVANGFSSLVGLVLPLIYFKLIRPNQLPHEWIHWINRDAFKGWGRFLQLSIPSTIMGYVEGGAFEVMTILAGVFSIKELTANTILNDISMKIYISWYGVCSASTALIGK